MSLRTFCKFEQCARLSVAAIVRPTQLEEKCEILQKPIAKKVSKAYVPPNWDENVCDSRNL